MAQSFRKVHFLLSLLKFSSKNYDNLNKSVLDNWVFAISISFKSTAFHSFGENTQTGDRQFNKIANKRLDVGKPSNGTPRIMIKKIIETCR
jgi:chitinase